MHGNISVSILWTRKEKERVNFFSRLNVNHFQKEKDIFFEFPPLPLPPTTESRFATWKKGNFFKWPTLAFPEKWIRGSAVTKEEKEKRRK